MRFVAMVAYVLSSFNIVENSYNKLERTTVPELQRSNMASVILQLKALAIDNVLRFHYLSVSRCGHVRVGT